MNRYGIAIAFLVASLFRAFSGVSENTLPVVRRDERATNCILTIHNTNASMESRISSIKELVSRHNGYDFIVAKLDWVLTNQIDLVEEASDEFQISLWYIRISSRLASTRILTALTKIGNSQCLSMPLRTEAIKVLLKYCEGPWPGPYQIIRTRNELVRKNAALPNGWEQISDRDWAVLQLETIRTNLALPLMLATNKTDTNMVAWSNAMHQLTICLDGHKRE